MLTLTELRVQLPNLQSLKTGVPHLLCSHRVKCLGGCTFLATDFFILNFSPWQIWDTLPAQVQKPKEQSYFSSPTSVHDILAVWCNGRGARLVPGDFVTNISTGDWLCVAGTATAHVRERILLVTQSIAASYLPWAGDRIFNFYLIFNTVMDLFQHLGARTQLHLLDFWFPACPHAPL